MRRVRLDTLALDRFLASVERRAYRMAVIATGHSEEALDIVQDAMFKLSQKYADRNENEWGPLFHRIVQSTIRDWYRRQKVRNRWRRFLGKNSTVDQAGSDLMQDDGTEAQESMTSGAELEPVAHLVNDQAIEALDDALHRLPNRQQQAFLLRIWEGFNVKETATAMSCSQGSVKTHLSRALFSLREQMEDHRL